MVWDTLSKWFSKRIRLIFTTILVILAAAFIVSVLRINLTQNVESRALSDVNATITMQTTTYKDYMDEQFQALRLVADMLQSGRHFTSEGIQPTLTSVVNTFELCTLCFADTSGNTTDYQGNVLGSCYDREYFQEIMDGTHTQICEYLAATKNGNDPRIILSVPAYDANDEMIGVLFCSKEISVLEHSLFEQSGLFTSDSALFICDQSGQVLAANQIGYAFFAKHNIEEKDSLNINDLSSSAQRLAEESTVQLITVTGTNCFAGYKPVDECGWGLYCFVDQADASETYSDNQKRIENTVAAVVLVFALALAYIVVLGKLYLNRKEKEAQSIRRNYENYKNILCEARCAVVEYNLNNLTLNVIQPGIDELKLSILNGPLEAYEQFKQAHPEYDFDELKTELELAKADGKTYSFESLLTPEAQKLCWLRTTIIPIANENGAVETVLFAVFDVSDVHQEADLLSELYANIPAGVHRCYLDKPIHVEYFSDGFCKMVGYTHDEIDKIIGSERKYSLLICEEDRPAFSAFVKDLSIHGGTQTCEYRIVCANGSLLAVSDTMDAKRSSSGTMYGYSIVTDQHAFLKMQQELQQELTNVKYELEQSRIKNANSQMQPHFLYNALSSIREIVLEDPQYASDLIYDFTTHLRACIRSMSGDSMISFGQELENIKAYVNIEKMRFGNKLSIEYDCHETEFDLIPLSIQPLVENAIRHGIFERGAAGGTVIVRSSRGENCFVVCVEDNGTGFDFDEIMAQVKSGKRDSNGLSNLIFRFKTLMNATVNVESKPGSGTKITVTIPTGGKQ